MSLLAPVKCDEGERIVAYLDHLGRIEGDRGQADRGRICRRASWRAAIKRERIVNLLTWLINQKRLGLSEERKHERVVPRISASKLILPNGDVHQLPRHRRLVERRLDRLRRQAADRDRDRSRAHAGPRRAPSRPGRGNKIRRASGSRQYRPIASVRPSAALCFIVN